MKQTALLLISILLISCSKDEVPCTKCTTTSQCSLNGIIVYENAYQQDICTDRPDTIQTGTLSVRYETHISGNLKYTTARTCN